MLNDDQVGFFKEFGFLVFRRLLSDREVEQIGKEAESAAAKIYGDQPGGPQGKWVPLLGNATPFNSSLLEDPRFYAIALEVFDEALIGVNTDMLFWQGDTGWHRDLDVPGNTGLKIIYYLDALRAENGALRVVPGSHIEPHETEVPEVEPLILSTDDTDYQEKIRGLTRAAGDKMLPSVVVESEPGDVVAFEMPLLHSSFGGAPDRRLGATVYWYPSPTEAQAEARRQEVRAIHSNHKRMFEFPLDEPYCHPDWIAGAAGNPVRSRWVECLKELEWIPDSG
jgi:hypothetical protein